MDWLPVDHIRFLLEKCETPYPTTGPQRALVFFLNYVNVVTQLTYKFVMCENLNFFHDTFGFEFDNNLLRVFAVPENITRIYGFLMTTRQPYMLTRVRGPIPM